MAKVDLFPTIKVEDVQENRTLNQFGKYHGYKLTIPDPTWQAIVPDPNWQATIPDPANPGGPNIPNPVARQNIANPTPQPQINNPESKKQFMRRKCSEFIQESIRSLEANEGAEAARKAAADKATAEVVLTWGGMAKLSIPSSKFRKQRAKRMATLTKDQKDSPLKTFTGKKFVGEGGEGITLRDMCLTVLENEEAGKKIKAYHIGNALLAEGDTDLTVDQVSQLKALLEKSAPTSVLGAILAIIDPTSLKA